MFQKRVIDKEYEALAPHLHGHAFPFTYRSRMVEGDKFFTMKEVEGEPNSETVIDVIEQREDATLYRLLPHTGRQHQLRVHLAALGIPIINDAFYPVALPCKQDDVSAPLKLLARRIEIAHHIVEAAGQHASTTTMHARRGPPTSAAPTGVGAARPAAAASGGAGCAAVLHAARPYQVSSEP